jgi:uncharacterized protein
MMENILDWWMPQTDGKDYRQIGFWGGEPLLEWDLIQKAVRYVQSMPNTERIEYGGTTNGVLYTEEKVEWGLENNCLFLVSLDGPQDVHDSRRKTASGKGSWKVVDRNVRKALELFPRQRVRATLSAKHVDRFYATAQYFLEDLGVQHYAFSPVFEDDWNEEALEKLAEQFELVTDLTVKMLKKGHTVELKHLDDVAKLEGKGQPQNPCGAGNKYSSFSVDGVQFPCHRFNKHGLTTQQRINHPMALAVPDGDSFRYVNKDVRRQFIDFHQTTRERCGDCEAILLCQGGCWATNYDMTGDIGGQMPSQCGYQKVLLKAGEGLKQKIKDAGLTPMKEFDQGQSCNCYNMCYLEGTDFEVSYVNAQSDIQCLCYNTNYGGQPDDQHRPMYEVRQERIAQARIVNAAVKLMGDYNNEEGRNDQKDSSSNEQVHGSGTGKQDNSVQHAGTDKRTDCGADGTACKGNCGCKEQVKEEDKGGI